MFRVLSAAYEEVPLWDLTAEIRNYRADGTVYVEPALRREEIVDALDVALRERHITLYDPADPGKTDLSPGEARKVVHEPEYWFADRAPRTICLFLTDSGLEALPKAK